ncbi:hypothetical protein O181_006144 [Austropuccinia psidii MF-1]|uniref:Uncharacterized protein n=1 Tax=Austropuccinia psidii MF-1 TaxID=1389203 RepID=A0A9Q3BJI0_9BASI|nr:hypothetical protein [Austropuccinia psidii MF-1]
MPCEPAAPSYQTATVKLHNELALNNSSLTRCKVLPSLECPTPSTKHCAGEVTSLLMISFNPPSCIPAENSSVAALPWKSNIGKRRSKHNACYPSDNRAHLVEGLFARKYCTLRQGSGRNNTIIGTRLVRYSNEISKIADARVIGFNLSLSIQDY